MDSFKKIDLSNHFANDVTDDHVTTTGIEIERTRDGKGKPAPVKKHVSWDPNLESQWKKQEEALVQLFEHVARDRVLIDCALGVYLPYRNGLSRADWKFCKLMFHKSQDPEYLWKYDKEHQRSVKEQGAIVAGINSTDSVLNLIYDAISERDVKFKLPECQSISPDRPTSTCSTSCLWS
ncbi:uncharacterized protein LOC142338270 [Convolutriloba macropyga]|uniref:uncharacterized protein LOC142338270 n=1 Tax=Convolutriloba macropyga TaxID=536237 RepID=UPI003F525EDA